MFFGFINYFYMKRKIQFYNRCCLFLLVLFLLLINNQLFSQCPTITNPNQSFCDSQTPKISNLQVINNGGGIKWFATATSTTPLSNSSSILNNKYYYVDDNTGSCGARSSVLVTIYSSPSGSPFQGVCVDDPSLATIANLSAVGNNVQWYSAINSSIPLSTSTVLTDNTFYYANQTNPNTGCLTSKLTVLVKVGVVPTPTGDSIQKFCNDPNNVPTVANLIASGSNNWYLNSEFGVALEQNAPLIDGETYYATTTDPPCESKGRLEVLVSLYDLNQPGTNGTLTYCSNQLVSTAPFNLFDILGGIPDINGTWNGPVGTTNGYLGTIDISTLTLTSGILQFTYTVNNTVCPSTSSTVAITILPSPTASVSFSPTTICNNSTSSLTFTGTPNALVTYTINGGSNQTITLDSTGAATLNNTYTVGTTVQLVSVTSSGTPSCTTPLTQSVTLTVVNPTASVSFNPTSICSGDTSTITFSGTPDAIVTYTINGGGAQTITLDNTGIATIATTYTTDTTLQLVSAATTGTQSCSNPLTQSVLLKVINLTASTAFTPSTICSGDNAILTFTGTPNAVVTYTIDGGSNQTITLNGAGTASTNNSYTSTTTVQLISVATVTAPICSLLLNQTLTLTVLPTPTASVLFNPTTSCQGDNADLVFTGTADAIVTYTINGGTNQTVTLDGTGAATISNSYTVDTTVTLISVATATTPSCVTNLTQSVTLTVVPKPIASVVFNPTSICSGDSADITFTGTADATVSYTINGGTTQTITLDSTGTAILTNSYTVDTTVTLVSVTSSGTPSCTAPLTQSVTLTVTNPTASVSFSPTTICNNSTSSLTFTGTPNALVTYTINGGSNQTITLDSTGAATLNNTYTVGTTVQLVSVTSSGTPSCTTPLTQSVTLTVVNPTASVSFNPTSICSGDTSTITFSGTPDAIVTYTINGGGAQTITLDNTGIATIATTYTTDTTLQLVSAATTGTQSCSNPLTQSVLLKVINLTASTAFTPSTICSGDNAILTFTGTPNAVVTYTIDGGSNQTITLNGAGTASTNNSYTSTTTVQLISVATVTAPICSLLLNQTLTLTVLPTPTASVLFNPTTSCQGDNADLVFTGTADAIVTYTINGGTNQTVTLDGTGAATISNSYTVDTTVTLISVATATTPSCVTNLTQSVTLTVVPKPIASVVFNPTSICSGDSADITFTGTADATVSYTINGGTTQTITLDSTGTAILTNSYTVDTTVTLVSVTSSGTPSCTAPLTQSVTLTVINPTASVSFSPTTICSGDNSLLTFTGTPNSTINYLINGFSSQTIILDNTGNATLDSSYTSNTSIQLINITTNNSPICSNSLSQIINLTVNDKPTATANFTPQTICEGDTAILSFSGTPDAIITYSINGGLSQNITLDGNGLATITNSYIVDNDVQLVSVSTSSIPSCSDVLTDLITLTVIPKPTATVSFSPTSICSGDSSLITFIGTPNATVSYSVNAGSSQNITLDSSGSATISNNYTVDTNLQLIDITSGGSTSCNNQLNQSINLTVVSPNANVFFSPTNICSGDASSLTFTGTPNAIVSYSVNSGNNQTITLDSTGNATINSTYSSTTNIQLINVTTTGTVVCSKDLSFSSLLTVTQPPVAGISTIITICSSSNPIDLFSLLGSTAQTGGTWNPNLNSGTGLFDPAFDAQGTYTYTVNGNPPCTPVSATVQVNINQLPNAGVNNSITYCSNQPSQDLFLLLGSNVTSGGIWTPTLSSGTGVFNPNVDTAQTYTYQVSVPFCPTVNSNIVVNVNQASNSGGIGQTITTCANSTSINLFNGLDGSQSTSGTWSDNDGTNALTNNIFNPSLVGFGTYHFTYTVQGVVPCSDSQSTVTVVVNKLPNPGTFIGSASFCNSDGTVDLATLLNGEDSGGIWTDSNPVQVSSIVNISNFTQANYVYTYTVTNSCGTTTSNVNFNILPSPVITSLNIKITSVCQGTDVLVSLLGMVDGQYVINYYLTGSNNQTNLQASVTINSGTGSFIIPSSLVPNAGSMVLYVTSILNSVTNCSSITNNVSSPFTINALPSILANNINIPNVCSGNNVVVNISNASNIPDGTYQFGYSISGGITYTGNSGDVLITNGTGQFTILSSVVSNSGNYSLNISSITSVTSCNNNGINVTVPFTIISNPTATGATLSSITTCILTDGQATISGATNLPDGIYNINYSLSGSNSNSNTTTVTLSNGVGSFVIPANALSNPGNTTLTITQISSTSSFCSFIGTINSQSVFVVNNSDTPQLQANGNIFCFTTNPTIANLTSNIIGSSTVIWYSTATGGTIYNSSDSLVDGTTYYAAIINSNNCESIVRLPVQVDLNNCSDLVIPDGFSPNGDGINDEFVIKDIGLRYPNFKIEIYNRYGNLVFEGDKNTANWNGTTTATGFNFGSTILPSGVYFYILNYNDGVKSPVQGRLYLNR